MRKESVSFASLMLNDGERAAQGQRKTWISTRVLLAVDNEVVVPVDTVVRVLVTAADVLHAWKIPAFGRDERRGARTYQRSDGFPRRT